MLFDTFQREGDLPGNVVDLYERDAPSSVKSKTKVAVPRAGRVT